MSKIYRVGQVMKLERPYEKNTPGQAKKTYVTIRIVKLHKSFALCKVNEKYHECFSYNDLDKCAQEI